MNLPARTMRLTAELAARVAATAGPVDAAPLPEGRRAMNDEDYDEAVVSIRSGAPTGDFWVFAYGSLIWKPGFDFVESRTALAHGWHRSFCLGWDRFFRGSPDRPGLMLALDRGGECKGVAYRLPLDAIEANLHRLARREMLLTPHPFPPRWIALRTEHGPLRALTFAMERKSPFYVGGLSSPEIADVLARAVGRSGSMADYLFSTVSHLEALGIHDRHLWQLQDMVAARIEAAHPEAGSPEA
jgi:glutathione-specific gamma-glutamylcyclotransferase